MIGECSVLQQLCSAVREVQCSAVQVIEEQFSAVHNMTVKVSNFQFIKVKYKSSENLF